MTEQELEDALMAYLASDDSDTPRFQSLTTIYEMLPERGLLTDEQYDDDEVEDKERIRAALDQLVADGMVQSRWGERDYEASYRITQDGFYQATVGEDALVASGEASEPVTHDSSAWTGTRLTYVDSGVLAEIRGKAGKLLAMSRITNFKNEDEKSNIIGLCEALVGLCDMAQPDISIIDEVTSHPMFKHYAALFVFIATIRGALGL